MMRILKWTLLALFLGLLLLAILLWTLPAQRAWGMVSERVPELVMDRVSGSLWEGEASRAALFGYPLGRLQWTLSPGSLLRGELAVNASIAGGTVAGSTRVQARRGPELRFSDVDFSLPAALLKTALDLPALEPMGQLGVKAAWLELLPGRTPMGQGRIEWLSAALSGDVQVTLGDVRVDFAPGGNEQLLGEISNQGGALELVGSFQMKGDDYELEVLLTARRDDPVLKEALLYLGQPLPDGSTLLQVTGKLQRPHWL